MKHFLKNNVIIIKKHEKKFNLFIVLFLTFFALNSSAKPNNLEDVQKNVKEVIDSTKAGISSTVKAVDTSSTFRMIYGDLKDGIFALGKSLKVGAEHVYVVFVKQQIVKAIAFLFLFILSLISGVLFYKQFGKIEFEKDRYGSKEVKEVRPFAFAVVFGIISVFTFLVFIFNIDNMIMGFVNPEYGAIKDVIDFVQGVASNTCRTCK